MISIVNCPRSGSNTTSCKRSLATKYVILNSKRAFFDGLPHQIHNMSAEIEAIGFKHAKALTKLKKVAEREAKLVESLRNAEESFAADIEALRAEHAQGLKAKEVEVDNLISRLKAEHEEALLERLAIAAAGLEKAHQDHAEAFGKLEAEHEVELNHRNDDVKGLLAKEKQTHEEALAAALASYTSTISLKESQHVTACSETT